MLRTSLLAAQGALVIAMVVGWFTHGLLGLANAAAGGALVLLFFGAGQGVHLLASEVEARAGFGLTLMSFLVRAALLGGALLAVQRSPRLAEAFSPVPFCWGVGLVLTAWLAGMFWAHAHLRIPVYDADEPV